MSTNLVNQIRHQMTPETIEAFLLYKKDNGASANMMRRYKGAANVLYCFLPDDKLLTREHLLAWRKNMEENNYAATTIQNYVKYINHYLHYVGCSEICFRQGKAKDITNMTFGSLTALEPTGEKNRGSIVWRCRCECGNIVELPATRLLVGNTLSCGCAQKKMRKNVFKNFGGTNLTRMVKEKVVNDQSVSGYVGVAPKHNKWQAYITYRGKRYSLGVYYDIEDAVKARAKAKELVIEDARELINFYDEIHKNDPKAYKKLHFKAPRFSKTTKLVKNRDPLSAVKRTDNTSGCTGVSQQGNKWEARISYQQIRYNLGTFDDKDDAITIRLKAEQDLKADPEKFVLEYSEKYKHRHN